ncbi:MAG: ABC transporter ATP-binding protein [Chloroflexi bacterium]|nr:ABC transporter ATP-binding protein [Chloroflexota bacterium]
MRDGNAAMAMVNVAVRRRMRGFDLDIAFSAGTEMVVLFGPSGAGKSMTLKTIAGIARADAGRIAIGDRVLYDSAADIDVPVRQRSVGYVPQGFALFPHLSVAQNIAFGLNGASADRRRDAVRELVAATGLVGLEERRPRQLSGGQQQRVALARALAAQPAILLLDEPFSALDTALHADLRELISALQAERGIPVLIVTHDLSDAFSLGDRVIVIEAGRVMQQGAREDIFYRPATRRVAELVGTRNILPMAVRGIGDGQVTLDWAGRDIEAGIYPSHDAPPVSVGQAVEASIRPTQIMIRRQGDTYEGRRNVFLATIVREIMGAEVYRLFARIDGSQARDDLEIELPTYTYFRLGLDRFKEIELSIRPEAVHIMHGDRA